MDKTNGEPNCFGGFGCYRYLSILIEDESLFCDENKEIFRQVLLQGLGSFRFAMNGMENDVPSFETLRKRYGRLDIGKSSRGFDICRYHRDLAANARDITEIVKAKMRIKMKRQPSTVVDNKREPQESDLIIISMNNNNPPTAEAQKEYIGSDILCTRAYLKSVGTDLIDILQRDRQKRHSYAIVRFNYIYDTTTDTCLVGDLKDVPSFYRSGNYFTDPDKNGNIWCILKEKDNSSLYPPIKETKDKDVKCDPTSLDSYLDSILGKRKEERDKAYQEILTKINQQ